MIKISQKKRGAASQKKRRLTETKKISGMFVG